MAAYWAVPVQRKSLTPFRIAIAEGWGSRAPPATNELQSHRQHKRIPGDQKADHCTGKARVISSILLSPLPLSFARSLHPLTSSMTQPLYTFVDSRIPSQPSVRQAYDQEALARSRD